MPASPINKKNLMEKLCYVVCNASIAQASSTLHESMKTYLRFRGDNIISRQTIMFWFEKNSNPSRQAAFKFIYDYLNEWIEYVNLESDQKKVYNQIRDYLSNILVSITRNIQTDKAVNWISTTHTGSIIIQNPVDTYLLDRFYSSWGGVYISYRMRLIRSNINPISQEVIRIFRHQREIRYQHWHLREGVAISRFDGVVILKSELIWLIGVSDNNQRFRICSFKRDEANNPMFTKYRWGLMHSDIPMSSSHEPAVTRILMVREDSNILSMDKFAKQNVKYIDENNVRLPEKNLVMRYIENNTSAFSRHDSIVPDSDGDHVLQVDQKTLEMACRIRGASS